MPINIKEVIVRVTVDANSQRPADGAEEGAKRRDGIVQECVDQVLEILKERQEP